MLKLEKLILINIICLSSAPLAAAAAVAKAASGVDDRFIFM